MCPCHIRSRNMHEQDGHQLYGALVGRDFISRAVISRLLFYDFRYIFNTDKVFQRLPGYCTSIDCSTTASPESKTLPIFYRLLCVFCRECCVLIYFAESYSPPKSPKLWVARSRLLMTFNIYFHADTDQQYHGSVLFSTYCERFVERLLRLLSTERLFATFAEQKQTTNRSVCYSEQRWRTHRVFLITKKYPISPRLWAIREILE